MERDWICNTDSKRCSYIIQTVTTKQPGVFYSFPKDCNENGAIVYLVYLLLSRRRSEGIEHLCEKTISTWGEKSKQPASACLCGSDKLHRERRQWQEEEEQAHSGCQPVSPRLHETLMDLIDWWEHQGVWAELSADWALVLGGKINLADTSRVRSAPHRAPIQQPWLIEEQSKVRLCLWINMQCVFAVIVRNVCDLGQGVIWFLS